MMGQMDRWYIGRWDIYWSSFTCCRKPNTQLLWRRILMLLQTSSGNVHIYTHAHAHAHAHMHTHARTHTRTVNIPVLSYMYFMSPHTSVPAPLLATSVKQCIWWRRTAVCTASQHGTTKWVTCHMTSHMTNLMVTWLAGCSSIRTVPLSINTLWGSSINQLNDKDWNVDVCVWTTVLFHDC